MDLPFKRIEVAANVAIIAVAVLLGIVLIKNSWIKQSETRSDFAQYSRRSAIRKTSAVANVDWNKNGQTLIMAVSSTCHFCTESREFYQQLAKARGRTRLLAVLPQPVEEATRYFESLGIAVDEIKQESLASIDVTGTPTLLLVNSDGIVTDIWVGKLQAEQEQEVLSKMRATRMKRYTNATTVELH